MYTDDLSDDDEAADGRNTIGRVPLHWYDEYEHIGYDLDGGRIGKRPARDALDAALAASDAGTFGRTVYDALNDREVTLSARELEIARRIQAGAFANPESEMYPDLVPYYSAVHDKPMPLNEAGYEPKRRFVPSKWETMRVMHIAKGIQEGRIKPRSVALAEKASREAAAKEAVHLAWREDGEDEDSRDTRKGPMHIEAPKLPPPGHAESYNPPAEYLFSAEEEAAWREMDPSERPLPFLPRRHASLRHVGAYDQFVLERHNRCLDLYLCPRAFKRRLNIDPESLVPRLPRPRELRPFPRALAQRFSGHAAPVRGLALSPDGQWLASAPTTARCGSGRWHGPLRRALAARPARRARVEQRGRAPRARGRRRRRRHAHRDGHGLGRGHRGHERAARRGRGRRRGQRGGRAGGGDGGGDDDGGRRRWRTAPTTPTAPAPTATTAASTKRTVARPRKRPRASSGSRSRRAAPPPRAPAGRVRTRACGCASAARCRASRGT